MQLILLSFDITTCLQCHNEIKIKYSWRSKITAFIVNINYFFLLTFDRKISVVKKTKSSKTGDNEGRFATIPRKIRTLRAYSFVSFPSLSEDSRFLLGARVRAEIVKKFNRQYGKSLSRETSR